MNETAVQRKTLIGLLVLVTLAFIWILLPYYGAVFWAVILGILFAPMQRRLLLRFNQRRNVAAALTLLTCLLIAVLPMIIVSGLLVQEGSSLYKRIESGELDIAANVERFKDMLPHVAQRTLERMGMGDLEGLRDKTAKGALQGSQFFASQAYSFGQSTFELMVSLGVMLYLLFFFLRDGAELVRKIRQAIPLAEQQKRRLQLKFNRVVRATVKGNLLVAIAQGALGGLIFWVLDVPSPLLWAVLMAFLSLLPAVGAGIVWAPVAVYFLLSGAVWQGVVLTVFGVGVIGLVDNLLRPLLVGKDTRMPDYLVLVSTLGGLAVFGLNGFVIGPLIAALFVSSWGIYSETRPQVQLPP
ncbi:MULTISPECIES: AI-2E family transporter [unclassified Pseudomonas]|uniref:AI-2E family transporter n=1 Tax=unclassified Pseudomonas TaxID=196821 RepID=UPI000BA323B2|nr:MULTISPECIES: AI-2E family transporter [unclassified Pseudomonas]MCU1720112.1 AI-2E family transporter [Pseudomonas sp. 5P_5.1_Bac1]MCU1731737.1 AI-2E family transporter [Pseudomonas sp. 20P_3.2_Bac4]MCU1743793.1 AI-2E family transporter [Pseudomonas sp. 20P_3.2_Bac5]